MWRAASEAHPGGMHPYQHITLAHDHMADLQAAAHRQPPRAPRPAPAESGAAGTGEPPVTAGTLGRMLAARTGLSPVMVGPRRAARTA